MKNIKQMLAAFVSVMLFSVTGFALKSPEIYGRIDIKTEDLPGLRTVAVVDTDIASHENTVEYGFLVSRKVFLSGNGLTNYDLTLDCKVSFSKGVAKGVVDGETVDKFFDKTDTKLYFAGHFYGISPQYYTDIIVARPYIISVDKTAYGEPVEMSIYTAAKDICNDKELFESLPEEQKKILVSVITAVEGEPYDLCEKDMRIVVSAEVKKNANPTYSVYYDLYNPFNGEYLYGIKGRKSSKNYDEIALMLLENGNIVPMYDGIVQDTTAGYVFGNLSEFSTLWIGGYDSGKLSLSPYDNTLKCKDCVKKYVFENSILVSAGVDTPVSVFDGDFEKMSFSASSMDKVQNKDVTLLCRNGEVYSDYIKAYVSVNKEGMCEYIIVAVNDGENSALDEKCQIHSEYTANFYVDGRLYDSQSVLYNSFATLPVPPEKEGYTFKGWSMTENGTAADVESVFITENTLFYAVFEKNPVYYTVTFKVNGEEFALQQVLEGECPKEIEIPILDGYEFVGWSSNQDGTVENPEDIAVNENTVYHAVFEKLIIYYDVTFIFDGEALIQTKVLSGETATVPDITPETPEGYKFVGWSTQEDGDRTSVIDVPSYVIEENTTFYSVIITNPNSDEFMEKLSRGYTQLISIKRSTGLTKEVLKLLTDCIGYVLEDAQDFVYVDKVYVGLTYAETVARTKAIVNEEMTSSERSAFVNLITSTVDKDVQDFLYDYFDISTKI